MKSPFIILLLSSCCLFSCDNIQDSRPATSMTGKTVNNNPNTIAFTDPNCNPTVNASYCSMLFKFNLTFGGSSYQPNIVINGNEGHFTYTNTNNDIVSINVSPFVPGKSCNYIITDNPVLGENKSYININGNSLSSSSKLNAVAYSDTLHLKFNAWNNSYNMVFCATPFMYTSNFTNDSKNIEGRFDFIYP